MPTAANSYWLANPNKEHLTLETNFPNGITTWPLIPKFSSSGADVTWTNNTFNDIRISAPRLHFSLYSFPQQSRQDGAKVRNVCHPRSPITADMTSSNSGTANRRFTSAIPAAPSSKATTAAAATRTDDLVPQRAVTATATALEDRHTLHRTGDRRGTEPRRRIVGDNIAMRRLTSSRARMIRKSRVSWAKSRLSRM